MRTVLYYLVVLPWTALCLVVSLILGLFPGTKPILQSIGQDFWAPVWLKLSGVKVRVSGALESLDPQKPYVFVSNHQSYFDIPATLTTIPHRLRFIAKRELLYIPFVGFYLWRVGAPIVKRGSSKSARRALNAAARRIQEGTSVLVYAEGTRTRTGKIGAFKRGAFVLAIRSKTPVIPITISGAFEVLNVNSYKVNPGTIWIHVGEPITTGGLEHEQRFELGATVQETIQAQFETMQLERRC